MKHRQIEAFRSVMQSGTTAQAANLMSVTQPAVSRLIADLEISLDFKLFERTKGRLHPTPEALRFYNGVERFYIGMDELDSAARQIREQRPSDLKICVTPALSTSVLPVAVKKFRESHPSVAFQIETASFNQIALKLQTHQATLGISHAFPDLPGILQEPLAEAAHVCAMHETHPLAKREVIRVEDLENENVLRILPAQQVNWDDTHNVLDGANIQYRSDIGIQSSHTGYSMIAENLAVGVIEPFGAGPWQANGVITRPFEPCIEYSYIVATPEGLPPSEHLAAFVRTLKGVTAEFLHGLGNAET